MQVREIGAGTIVLRLPNWVGDAVMATPALRALREAAAPQVQIAAVATPAICRLLAGLPALERLIPFERNGRHRGPAGLLRLARELRPLRARLFLVLPHSFSSALMARLAGAGHVVGYRTGGRGWLLHAAPRPPREGRQRLPVAMTRHYLDLLGAVGVKEGDERLELVVLPEESARVAKLLEQLGVGADEEFFAVNPGASFGPSKQWTQEGFAGTIDGLARSHGLRTLVLCGPGEEELARSIAARAGEAAIDTSQAPLPLESLKAVLQRCRLLVTTDTGPRHVATAFGTPTVVLMGPTDPRYTDSNLERTRVLRVEVECAPCHLKICPIDHRCMTRIGCEDALRAAQELLEQAAGPESESRHASIHRA